MIASKLMNRPVLLPLIPKLFQLMWCKPSNSMKICQLHPLLLSMFQTLIIHRCTLLVTMINSLSSLQMRTRLRILQCIDSNLWMKKILFLMVPSRRFHMILLSDHPQHIWHLQAYMEKPLTMKRFWPASILFKCDNVIHPLSVTESRTSSPKGSCLNNSRKSSRFRIHSKE